MSDKETIIVKDFSLSGVDKSVGDMTLLSQHGEVTTKVTKLMYKEGSNSYIGVAGRLLDGEVIKVGNLKKIFRVHKFHKMTDREGNIYKIGRLDKNPMTQTDIDSVRIGHTVRIVSRKSVDQKAEIFKTQHHIE